MIKIKASTVRMTESTKQRLKLINKGNSYEENLIILLEYFDRTGINPSSLKEHPIEVTMKGFDRTIAILKSIEKTKLDVSMRKLINIEKVLTPLAEWVQKGIVSSVDSSKKDNLIIGEQDGQITEEELTVLVELNQNLSVKIEELEEEIRLKNGQIFDLSNSSGDAVSGEIKVIKQKISDIAKRFEDGARKASFGNDYSLKQADFTYILQSLKNINR